MASSHTTRNWVDIANAARELLEGIDDVAAGNLSIDDLKEDRRELRTLLGTVDATRTPAVSGVLPTDEVADIVTGLEDSHEALRPQLAAKHREIERLRAGMSEDYAYWFDKATVLDRERADWKLWNEESEAQLAAAHDVIRRLRTGWEYEPGEAPGPSEWARLRDDDLWVEVEDVTEAEQIALDAADATPTEAHDGE